MKAVVLMAQGNGCEVATADASDAPAAAPAKVSQTAGE
jgi:hypothetical protein